MTMILAAAGCYTLLMVAFGRWAFPKGGDA